MDEKTKITVTYFDEEMSRNCGIEMKDSIDFNSVFEMIRFFQGPGADLKVIEIEARVVKNEV